jgi:hypothetical protein
MTTSYILERQKELRSHKELMRAAEKAEIEKMEEERELRQAANEARIKAKVERIARGDPAPVKTAVSIEAPAAAEVKASEEAPKPKEKSKVSFKKKPVVKEQDDAAEEGE